MPANNSISRKRTAPSTLKASPAKKKKQILVEKPFVGQSRKRARPITRRDSSAETSDSDEEDEDEDLEKEEGEEMDEESNLEGGAGLGEGIGDGPTSDNSRGLPSRQTHKIQKTVYLQRRAAKAHADVLTEAKYVWDLARQKKLPASERQKHVKALMDVIRGKVTEIVFKHDASRIVQTVVKYGGKKERGEVAVELKGKYREMAQNKYSKFLVKKLIKLCPSHRTSILLEFQSHVLRLLLHREATSVLADAFEVYANAYERTLLLRDFYGKEVALFSFTSGSEQDKELSKKGLHGILEKQDSDSQQRALNAVKENLTAIFNNPDKGAVSHAIVHRALWEYLVALNNLPNQADQEKQRREIFECCQDVLAEMVHTKDGSRAVREFVARGTSKDRKQIVKALKMHVERICLRDEAQVVLFTALDVIDDTKLTAKSLVSEITSHASTLCESPQGRRALFYLLVPRSPKYFTPTQIATLAETDAIRAQTSKKEADVRTKELRQAASEELISFVEKMGSSLVREPGGSLVVSEVMLHAEGDKAGAMEALLKPLSTAYPSTEQSNPHPIDLSHTSRMYKSLLQGGHFIHSTQTITRSSAFSPLAFASAFVRIVGREITLAMAKGNGAFVVAELCERLKEEASEEARKEVKEWFRPEDIKEIEIGKGKGSAVLLEKIQNL